MFREEYRQGPGGARRKGLRAAYVLLRAVILFVGLSPPVRAQTGEVTVFFFCPEISVNNFNALKAAFDGVLATCGNYKFQPVARHGDFESLVNSDRSDLFLMSSSHFRQLPDRTRLDPIMVGVRDQRIVQEYGLYVASSRAEISSLRGGTIAIAGSRENARLLLLDMLGESNAALADSVNFLVVPKQIDALMAVNFGSAHAAMATESSVRRLSEINPNQAGKLKPLAIGKPVLLPVLAGRARADARPDALLRIFNALREQPGGLQCLNLLGLDGMKDLSASEREELRQ